MPDAGQVIPVIVDLPTLRIMRSKRRFSPNFAHDFAIILRFRS